MVVVRRWGGYCLRNKMECGCALQSSHIRYGMNGEEKDKLTMFSQPASGSYYFAPSACLELAPPTHKFVAVDSS